MTPAHIQIPASPTLAERRALRKDLRSALRPESSPAILDFSNRRVLDHNDIDLLLESAAHAAGRDVEICVVAGSPCNRILLEVTRIDSLLPVFTSLSEALDQLQRTSRKRNSAHPASDSSRTTGVHP